MRRVWAEKVANGSVPDDIGREKQNDLTRQLVRARHELTELEVASTDIEVTLNEALDLVRDCATAYKEADSALRREWNQTFFERLEVNVTRSPALHFGRPSTPCLTRRSSGSTSARSSRDRPRNAVRLPLLWGAVPANPTNRLLLVSV